MKPTKKKLKDKEVTPLMRQYLREKAKYPDAILLFRVGDFYEMFYEDAIIGSEALGIALTSRDKNKENPVPLCGVPHHALKTYMTRLLDQGFKVAVCEQIENPKTAKGVVKRAVTQIVTPGLILDEDQLEAKISNYIATITSNEDFTQYGLAICDISTGEFKITHIENTDDLKSEIVKLSPKQLIASPSIQELFKHTDLEQKTIFENLEDNNINNLNIEEIKTLIKNQSDNTFPEHYYDNNIVLAATYFLIKTLQSTRPIEKLPIYRIISYIPGEYMIIDENSIFNLELFETMREKKKNGALISVLDNTMTAMGGRKLRAWMLYPLLDTISINKRYDAIEILIERTDIRNSLRSLLKGFPDLERLTSRVIHKVASPKDLGAIRNALEKLPSIVQNLSQLSETTLSDIPQMLEFSEDLAEDILNLLNKALVEDPPLYLKDGGVIRKGFNEELDVLIELSLGGKAKILEIEKKERKSTGISSLRIKYNKVFGYYIEIPRSKINAIPASYTRKQTLRNAERFVTEELSEHEYKVLKAEEERITLEEKLFIEIRDFVSYHSAKLFKLAKKIAQTDVLASLAEVAHKYDFHRPKLIKNSEISLTESRHPVIERQLQTGQFVPNNIKLSHNNKQILIITGPNMAGKSTIIRQVAISVLMAQMGSFIPSAKAKIGICDRIFSRVGASDNISRGDSTFMVEMKETANILRNATSRSLVILDEIGRGTSTYDGVSIAWAVVEYLHDQVGCNTLFATHYHELAVLSDIKPRIFNSAVAVKEWQGNIVFLHKLVSGSVNRSYGIHVAKLAGVPNEVIRRAYVILKALEKGESLSLPISTKNKNQLSLFDINEKIESNKETDNLFKTSEYQQITEIIQNINNINTDELTPLKSLEILYSLQKQIKNLNLE